MVSRSRAVFVAYALARRYESVQASSSRQFMRSSGSVNGSTSISDPDDPPSEVNGTSVTSVSSNKDTPHSTNSKALNQDEVPLVGGKEPFHTASATSEIGKTFAGEEHDPRQGVKQFISQFLEGTKMLWAEFRLARRTSIRRKAGDTMTFREDRLLRQVPRDIAKALPLMMVFSVPFAGYIAPVIGFFFPKSLLPAQFWKAPQRMHYMLEDAIHQEMSSFPKLVHYLAIMSSPPRPNSTGAQLRASRGWFAGEGSLERLSKEHLIQLVKACSTISPVKRSTASFVRSRTLVEWLQQEATNISKDDILLKQYLRLHHEEDDEAGTSDASEGVGEELRLTPSEVAVLCWERGLLRSQHWSAGNIPEAETNAMLQSLEEWLVLYDEVSGALGASVDSPDSTSTDDGDRHTAASSFEDPSLHALPPSMILHAPALLRLRCSAGGVHPVCHLRVPGSVR